MNPSTTFTLASQLPLLSFVSSEGKSAKIVKGSAKATENASIVNIGIQNCPWVDWMRTVPTIGPVQENDTSTRVSAIKNTPTSPFFPDLPSALFTHDEGRVISNAPKKDAAKTIKTMKKTIFGSQCVASQLNMSAVTASPPAIQVMRMMTVIGKV